MAGSLRVLACALLLATAPAAAGDRLRLIALNDFHGHLLPSGGTVHGEWIGEPGAGRIAAGGVAQLAALVSRLRAEAPASLVVAAGDLIGASPPESGLFHDEPSIAALSALGLAYSALGNHEFDAGLAELRRLQQGGCKPGGRRGLDTCVAGEFSGAGFAYLAANVIDARTGAAAFPPSAVADLSLGTRRLRLGLVGAVLRGTPHIVAAEATAGLRFVDEARAVNRAVAALQAQGVEAIVLLIHEGAQPSGPYDAHGCPALSGALLPILKRLSPAVDVVISGHTHRAYACEIDGRLVSSAGAYGRMLTVLDLDIGADGDIAGGRVRNLAVRSTLAPDPALQRLLAPWLARARPMVERVVGHIAEDFRRSAAPGGQSTLGRLVADAQLAATRPHGADIALTNPGGLRADLRRSAAGGKVTYGAVHRVQPFGNTLVVLELRGAQLLDLLEQTLRGRQPRPLQASSNLAYRWSARRKPGARLERGSVRIDGKPVAAAARYRVTVNDYLAGGGDGYRQLRGLERTVTSIGDAEALAAYLQRSRTPLRSRPGLISAEN